MQNKPKRNNGSQEKLERKIAAMQEAIATFKNKDAFIETYGRAAALRKLNAMLFKMNPEYAGRNADSLREIMRHYKIKF